MPIRRPRLRREAARAPVHGAVDVGTAGGGAAGVGVVVPVGGSRGRARDVNVAALRLDGLRRDAPARGAISGPAAGAEGALASRHVGQRVARHLVQVVARVRHLPRRLRCQAQAANTCRRETS